MANNRNELNKNLAQMLKGGVIMDVTTPEQAKIAQDAGACAVMALERIPADIRAAGGVSRMSDPAMIKGIQEAVSIPVIASGGAGKPEHMLDAVTKGKASAALIASIVHYGQYTIRQCKEFMASHGVPMRMTW